MSGDYDDDDHLCVLINITFEKNLVQFSNE